MTPVRMLGVLTLLALMGCGRAEQRSSEAEKAATEEKDLAAEDHSERDEVEVEEGMLRDLRITTAAVESRSGDEQVVLLGELAVDESSYAEVGVPIEARVMRLLANAGDSVRAGAPLLELQSPEVGRARSEYAAAAAETTLAESVLARKSALANERIAPLREVEEAEAQLAAARAEVRGAAASLTSLGLSLPGEGPALTTGASLFTLYSPVRGTVIARTALRGQMLEPGTKAFRIADLSTLWLTVHAFERDAVRVKQGTRARVSFAALPGEEFSGAVTLVGREVSSESRTVDVRIEIRNRNGVLRPGMSASAALPIGDSDVPVLAVPVAAVQRVGDSWCVFLPKENEAGHFEIRKIGRGRDLGVEVEVLSGLKAGEVIVVEGAFLLKSQAEKGTGGHEDH